MIVIALLQLLYLLLFFQFYFVVIDRRQLYMFKEYNSDLTSIHYEIMTTTS